MRNVLLIIVFISAVTSYARTPKIPALSVAIPAFRENKGQVTDPYGHTRKDVQFQFSGNGPCVFIGNGRIHYQFNRLMTAGAAASARTAQQRLSVRRLTTTMFHSARLDVSLIGADTTAVAETEEQVGGYENYYLPAFRKTVETHSFQKITYRNIYPFIDWVLYLKNGQLKYDFVVRPGGKVENIRLLYAGATALQATANGNVIAETMLGEVQENAPYSYERASGRRVDSRFVLKGDTLSFTAGMHTGTLVIDPVIEWATYYGGSGNERPFYGYYTGDVCCDRDGNISMMGSTTSPDNIATAGAYETTWQGYLSALLVKFSKAGQRLWATYYGSPVCDYYPEGKLSCDNNGNLYIGGFLFDYGTPADPQLSTPNSFQPDYKGGSDPLMGAADAVLAKFSSAGQLSWATYFGGDGGESCQGVACDKDNNVYITGYTSSTTGIATPGSYRTTAGRAYLAKFTSDGMRLWGTYYDDNDILTGRDMVADSHGDVCWLVGYEIIKLTGAGAFLWEHPVGASGIAVACDNSDNFYVTGTVDAAHSIAGFATANAFQTQPGNENDGDGFLSRYRPDGVLDWRTYYGGPGTESMTCVACDKAGHVYIGGYINPYYGFDAAVLATPNGYQTQPYLKPVGQDYTEDDCIIGRFDTTGKREWASFYGGLEVDEPGGLACDGNTLYMEGGTGSTDHIATAGSYQSTASDYGDKFLVKFDDCFVVAAPDKIDGSAAVCPGTTHTYTASPVTACAASYEWMLPAGWTGSSTNGSITVTAGSAGGVLGVIVNGMYGDTSFTRNFPVSVYITTPPVITTGNNTAALNTSSGYTSYQWLRNDAPVAGANRMLYDAVSSGTYKVVVTDSNGCIDTSGAYVLELHMHLFVPNMFSPNGDGNNDVLKVYGNELKQLKFSVYNQWGQQVYESRDINGAWDGRSGGKAQPAGVYVYTLKVTAEDGTISTRKGTVTLLR